MFYDDGRIEESVIVSRHRQTNVGMGRLMDKCAFRPMMMGWLMIWDMHEDNDIDASALLN